MPETAQTRTTRHDMIVSCLYLRLSREFNAELEVRHTATSDQNQKPDIWPSTVQDHRRGVTLPRQMDHYCNEKLKKHRDGTLPIIYGTDGSLHPKSRRHLEELHADVEKLSVRAALPPRTWPRRPTSI
ncbi:ATP-dependent RNA helicase/ diadenosine tetraphosphatase [Giardia duodenalis assemblage B]|uniref:ATP-dependent RNA helicase/ diadenosine tetraphosphatase n=1 Tax=Giardia duodenalis assemblage B TaxID=1394984 RepID=A0A132NX53_GIAIN|nr:ATP-dependent RNA helicase/ diadenosine tetraphosphatase [Giardia intestinalis assemblage B]